ncbi:MAG TPA: alginate lyase family protein [Bryobacteraceae bacterium]|nr:alginate lyase family protein [Bryobacteraceae bacterium]
MRSFAELSFRLNQELADLRLFITRPTPDVEPASPLPRLPDPAVVRSALAGTPFAAEVERLARLILRHHIPLFDQTADFGEHIAWRRDFVHQVESPLSYFRFVPYLDFSRVGDHKIIWELNRHQHLVTLAQAFLFTGEEAFLREIERQLRSWWDQNPYLRGINWASALEVAFRSLSWAWIWHLAGHALEAGVRRRLAGECYRHGRYIEHNLSVYFSPNTHLLGEAVALHALGVLFPAFPRAGQWARQGLDLVRQQMESQVRADGSHFEQSSYYHVYALDLFLFHQALAETTEDFRARLSRMAEYLNALAGAAGRLPFLGDDDGGRLFHPYGPRDQFARATLATCAQVFDRPEWLRAEADLHPQAAWWLPPWHGRSSPCSLKSRLFPQSGAAILRSHDFEIVADAGPFGHGSGGHSHSDTLNLVARQGAHEILIDPGTYTYVADPRGRAWFRGSAAHNTLRVDAMDQAEPAGPFRWHGHPTVEILEFSSTPQQDFLDARCRYRGFSHRRRLLLLKPGLLVILDDVDGPAGEHLVEQFWHPGEETTACAPLLFDIGGTARLAIAGPCAAELLRGGEHGWRSRVFGGKEEAPVVRVSTRCALPVSLAATLDLGAPPPHLEIESTAGEIILHTGLHPPLRFPVK